jgi:uncharacterized protein
VETNSKNIIKPSKKWYLLSILFFLAGPIIGAYLIYNIYKISTVQTTSFRIPGTWVITVPQPGEYSLWTSTNNPEIYPLIPQDLNNFHLKFTNLKTDENFTFSPKVSWKTHKGNYFTYSLGTLRFNQAGSYQVNTLGITSLYYKIHLRQPSLLRIFTAFSVAIFMIFLGILAGIISAIIILIKRINSKNMQTKELKSKSTDKLANESAINWAIFCHLSGFAGFLFPAGNIIAPLLIWLLMRDAHPYINDQGKEAVNFQISISIYYLISAILVFWVIGIFLVPILVVYEIIVMIFASIEAGHAKPFRYPLTIRFLK